MGLTDTSYSTSTNGKGANWKLQHPLSLGDKPFLWGLFRGTPMERMGGLMRPEWLGVPGCTENEGLALTAWEATAHGAGHRATGLQKAPGARRRAEGHVSAMSHLGSLRIVLPTPRRVDRFLLGLSTWTYLQHCVPVDSLSQLRNEMADPEPNPEACLWGAWLCCPIPLSRGFSLPLFLLIHIPEQQRAPKKGCDPAPRYAPEPPHMG